jgi:FtsZ-binding cell division protein ZapB
LEDRNVIANEYKSANKSLYEKNKKQKEDISDLRNKIDCLITENHRLKSDKEIKNS